MEQITLNRKERLSYVLQLRILQKLSESDYEKRDLEEKIEALMGGYEGMYEDLFDEFGIDESILSKDECEKVWDILEMYRGIIYSYNRLVEDKTIIKLTEGAVAFPGLKVWNDFVQDPEQNQYLLSEDKICQLLNAGKLWTR